MVSRREFYARVEKLWPAGPLPTLTADEATKAAKKLWRFATGMKVKVELTSGNHRTAYRHGVLVVNPEEGWHMMVHHLSHWAAYANPHKAGTPGEHGQHSKAHARLEARMVKQVIRRGWLTGSLRTPEPAPVVPPTADEELEAKAEKLSRMLAKAETRLKRATTIFKKWNRRMTVFMHKHSKV